MPIIVVCTGCGHNIDQDKNSKIQTPNNDRVLGHVHRTPSMAPVGQIPYCHRMAFKNLKNQYPDIIIEGRLLNTLTSPDLPKRKSSGNSMAARYASMQSGRQMFAIHSPRSTVITSY